MNSNKITSVTDPTLAQDAATKNYVDTQVASKDALSELSGTSDDIAEGTTNLYFTNERVDDRFNNLYQAGTGISGTYDDASNTYTVAVDFTEFDTDSITEGVTNLFYSNTLVDSHLTAGDAISYSSGTINVDISGATDGTGITVDSAADMLLLYDADTGNIVKVYSSQVGGSGGGSWSSANGFFMLNG